MYMYIVEYILPYRVAAQVHVLQQPRPRHLREKIFRCLLLVPALAHQKHPQR